MSLKSKVWLENKANELREEMGVRSKDPVSIHQILKYKQIVAYFQPMEEKGFSGMAVKVTESKRNYLFMLVNTAESYGKQRFTAAHELYHLLYQDDFQSSYDTNIYGNKDPEEVNANNFATYLLLPENGLLQLIPESEMRKDKVTIETLLKLEQNYRCSRIALLLRLKHLGVITEDYINNNKGNVIRTAMEYGYDASLYSKTNKIELVGDYNLKARRLFDQGKISQAKYFSYLRDMNIDLKEDMHEEEGNIG